MKLIKNPSTSDAERYSPRVSSFNNAFEGGCGELEVMLNVLWINEAFDEEFKDVYNHTLELQETYCPLSIIGGSCPAWLSPRVYINVCTSVRC